MVNIQKWNIGAISDACGACCVTCDRKYLISSYLFSNRFKGTRKSKKRFFFIAFFNSITIQKVNAKVLNHLDEKWETKRLSAFRKNWLVAGNRNLFYFCSVLQWLQENGGSDQFGNFSAFADNVFVNMNFLWKIFTFWKFLEFFLKILIFFLF